MSCLYENAKIGFFGEYIYLCETISVMIVKRTNVLLLISLLILSVMTGCGKYDRIRVVPGKVVSVAFNGLRGFDISTEVKVDNPAGKIIFDEIEGDLKCFGKIVGRLRLDPFVLTPRSVEKYGLKANVSIADGVGLMEVMSLMDMKTLDKCTLDLNVKGKAGGVKVNRKFRDIPLKKLLESKENEKI